MPARPPAAVAPRGPLPPGVYWRRRLFVGLLALAVVFVIARWLTGNSDGSSDAPAAEQAAARVVPTETVTVGAPSDGASTVDGARPGTTAASTRLAEPEGPCDPDDVAAVPSVEAGQAAGQDVALSVALQTVSAEACTWTVSSTSLVVRIQADGDQLWSTQQCRAAVPEQSVVVRRSVATVVPLTWNARESDQRCTGRTRWVLPGDFTIAAATLGGEPASADFALVSPAEDTTVDLRWVPAPGLG